jgi:hypothetical protein
MDDMRADDERHGIFANWSFRLILGPLCLPSRLPKEPELVYRDTERKEDCGSDR